MRTLSQIDADIEACETALRIFHEQRRFAIRTRIASIIADFDHGKRTDFIADKHGMSLAAVVALLWRNGRSRRGQKSVQHQLASIGP